MLTDRIGHGHVWPSLVMARGNPEGNQPRFDERQGFEVSLNTGTL
jgi:hypothetical protein